MNISQPDGASTNKSINKEEISVQYTHVDAVNNLVYNKGRNCNMNKLDVQCAFSLLPVLPC